MIDTRLKQDEVKTLCNKIDFLFNIAKRNNKQYRIIASKETFEPVLISIAEIVPESKKNWFVFYTAKEGFNNKCFEFRNIGILRCLYDYVEGDDIYDVYVSSLDVYHPNQDKGIGTQGLIALIDYARALNKDIIYLYKSIRTAKHNTEPNKIVDANLLFYSNIGFIKTEENSDSMYYSIKNNKPINFKTYFDRISNEELREKFLSVNV